MPIARPPSRMMMRPRRPSLIGMPAIPEAIPVAKGLIVEPSVPIPQPSRTTAAPVSAS